MDTSHDEHGLQPLFALRELPEDVLLRVFQRLPAPALLQVSKVCKQWCTLADSVFAGTCRAHGWRPARHPRGQDATPKYFPWRNLYTLHACRNCGKRGEFIVRKTFCTSAARSPRGERRWFLLCGICARKPTIIHRLSVLEMTLDLIGVTGKRLVSKMKRSDVICKRSRR